MQDGRSNLEVYWLKLWGEMEKTIKIKNKIW